MRHSKAVKARLQSETQKLAKVQTCCLYILDISLLPCGVALQFLKDLPVLGHKVFEDVSLSSQTISENIDRHLGMYGNI